MRWFKIKIILTESIMMNLCEAPFTSSIKADEIDPNNYMIEIRNKLLLSGIVVDSHLKIYLYYYLFSHFIDKNNAVNLDIPQDLLVTPDDRRMRKYLKEEFKDIFPYFQKIFFNSINLPVYKIEKSINNDILCYLKNLNEQTFLIDVLRKPYNNSMYDNIIKLCSPTKNDTFCDPFMGDGNILYRYIKWQKDYIDSNIHGYESDSLTFGTARILLFLQTFKVLDNLYDTNPLLNNFYHKGYDVIITRLPTNIHGITHAETCDRVKDLKIRGTKFEPLALQLIMKGLKKNGRACVIVTNSFLQSTSICAIETRKYLLDNYELEKIIEISNGNNENVIYFKNSGKPTSIIDYCVDFFSVISFDVKDMDENYILSKKRPILNEGRTITEKVAIPVKMDKNEQIIELLKEIRDLLKK